MWTLIKLLFTFTAISQSVNAYKVLIVYPVPTRSHQRPQQAISRALADAGHEVTVITPFPLGDLVQPNLRQINASFLFDAAVDMSNEVTKVETVWDHLDLCSQNVNVLTKAMLFSNALKNLIETERNNIDAVIVESLGFAALYQLKYEFPGAALIGVTSLEMWPLGHEHMGNPNHLLINPSVFWPSLELHELTFVERVKHVIDYVRYRVWYGKHLKKQNEMLKARFPHSTMNTYELSDQFDFAIECVSPVLGYVRPLLPNSKQIPFLHMEEPKALPKDLETYMNSSKKGVIYVSFGSTIRGVDIGDRLLKTLTTALGELNYDLLWKYETEDMPYKPKNAKVMTYTPQVDLLAHKNLKLFIFQGGLQSMDEAITRGVPSVVIPFFSDQDKNAHIVQTLGMGKKLLRKDITVENLRAAVTKVINNPKYKTKVEELRDKAWDRPMKPKDEAVWWIEYAIRNRGSHFLKYKGRDMPFYQYYLLDVIGAAVALIAVLVFALQKLLKGLSGSQLSKGSNKKRN